METRKVSFGDIDDDEDLDIFLSNVEFTPGNNRQNRLFVNDGPGNFTDETATQLPFDSDLTVDGIFEDVDLDGDLDIIVANVFGGPIKIYENDGLGHFINSTIPFLGANYFIDALGVIAKDFNGDGLNDIYICDRTNPNTNNKDILLIRNSLVNAQNDISTQELNMTVSPNPGKNIYTIQFENKSPDLMLITNANGRLIQSIKTTADDKVNIDLSIFPSGVYLVIAQYENNQQVIRKLIKE